MMHGLSLAGSPISGTRLGPPSNLLYLAKVNCFRGWLRDYRLRADYSTNREAHQCVTPAMGLWIRRRSACCKKAIMTAWLTAIGLGEHFSEGHDQVI